MACKEEKPKTETQEKAAVETKAKSVKLPAEKLDSGSKVIYLTFDDGPLPGSEAVNRLVNEQKFKASVFIVGKHSKNNRSSLRIIEDFKKNPYIDVCNHSYTHANNDYDKFYKRPDTAYADIVKNQNEIAFDLKIVRLPGRQLWLLPDRDMNLKVSSAGPTAELLKKDSFKIIGWDIEWSNKGNKPNETPEEILAKIEQLFKDDMTFTRNHLVILSHDVMFSKPEGEEALVKLVTLLRSKGYVLENIRHYPEKDVL
jgi:peptidoglycan/xylan/chitin deacetylase (PgdA/CDA1 family)